ncbi:hypothetical protein K2P97_09550 [bacterium]|nr:hypothetical protein [bacterium]
MLNTKTNPHSFSDILEDLLVEQQVPTSDFSAGWESHLEPFGLAQLMGEVHVTTYNKTVVTKAYPRPKHATRPIRPQRPSHTMNEAQTAAYQLLKAHCNKLQDNFNSHELKSAYRLSVLKTHPDQGGTSEIFQDVKKSYQILAALVKN